MITLSTPKISEKSMNLAQKGWFSFTSAPQTTKAEFQKHLEKKYGVHVVKIASTLKSSIVRRRGRHTFKTGSTKTFMVKLQDKEKIPGFETES